MGKITVETCHIEGLKVITPTVFGDERGYCGIQKIPDISCAKLLP